MRGSDEIMAEYLLKGAKMLGKTCPECGSPLFTVNGETYCVVCRENKAQSAKGANAANTANTAKAVNAANSAKGAKAGRNGKRTAPAGKSAVTESESDMSAQKLRENAGDEECTDSCGVCGCELRSEIEAAMTVLCRRIKSDTRPEDCVALMEALSIGADVLKKLE